MNSAPWLQGHQGKVSFCHRRCGVNRTGLGEARVEKEDGKPWSPPRIAVRVSKIQGTPSAVGDGVWSTVREVKKAMAGRCSDALAPVSQDSLAEVSAGPHPQPAEQGFL